MFGLIQSLSAKLVINFYPTKEYLKIMERAGHSVIGQ